MSKALAVGFEVLDHPADMGFRVWAPALPLLFAEAARALTTILVDLDSVAEATTREIEIAADDEEMLLYIWLSEILFLFDADGLLFLRYKDVEIAGTDAGMKLTARACGEEYSTKRHQIKTYVKAITLHQLKIERAGDSYQARVYVDI